jgi:HEAT repeat protein
MSKVLEQATAARKEGNWSQLNQYLQQLPLGKKRKKTDTAWEEFNQSELEQILNLALDVLEAGDFQERWEVAKIFPNLAEILLSQGEVNKLLKPLIEILQNEEADLELRWFAGRILGDLNHPTAIAALVDLLKTSEDEELVAMAAAALSSLGESAVKALSSLLLEPQTRLLATTSLSQIRHPGIIDPLLTVVDDPQVLVRSRAIEALSSFHDSRITPILFKALHDHAAAVRKEAVIALGVRRDLREKFDLLNHLKPLLYDFNREVCRQAAIALGRLGTDQAADALFNVLQSKATPVPLRIDFIRALGWVETAKALDYLQLSLADTSVECVTEIVRLLGSLNQASLKAKATQILVDFLNEDNTQKADIVKQSVAQSLGQLGEISAIDGLVGLLADNSVSVRLHALAALKNFPNADHKLEQLANNENLGVEMNYSWLLR